MNVLVSALLKWDSIPDIVVEKIVTGKVIPSIKWRDYEQIHWSSSQKKIFFDEDIQLVIRGIIQQRIFWNQQKKKSAR